MALEEEIGSVAPATATRHRSLPVGMREAGLLLAVYFLYTGIRVLADQSLGPARSHAVTILDIERFLHLDWEYAASHWTAHHSLVGLVTSYWYASSFYVVTPVVIAWAFTRHREVYYTARTVLLYSTLIALASYLLIPTAPPRFTGDYPDIVALHAGSGWWAQSSSSPKGVDGMANQFAAFPSMHVGWALWCALLISASGVGWGWRVLGYLYAAGTAAVVVLTGNHWVIDGLVGGLLVLGLARVGGLTRPRAKAQVPHSAPASAPVDSRRD